MAESIFFKSPEHKQCFMEAIQGHIHQGELDPFYGSALYILTASHSGWSSVKHWVGNDTIDFEDMLKHIDLTAGTDVLYHLAWNLFNGGEFRGTGRVQKVRQWELSSRNASHKYSMPTMIIESAAREMVS